MPYYIIMTSRLTFISGGAWSGKTARAESIAQSYEQVVWIGTALTTLPELAVSTKLLQTARPSHWIHVDAGFNLPETFEKIQREYKTSTIVVDSISQWLCNEFAKGTSRFDEQQLASSLERDVQEVCMMAKRASLTQPVIIVSSDFGQSLPPQDHLQRILRHTVGKTNQDFAQAATHVEILFAGIVIHQKKSK